MAYALVALGFVLALNASGAVNFAQGEFSMLGGMVAAAVLARTGMPLVVVIAFTIVGVTAIGVLVERLTIAPTRHRDVLNVIIVTIGASILLKGVAMVVLGKNAAGLPPFSGERPIRVLGAAFLPQALWILGVALAVMVLLHLFFEKTLVGKAIIVCMTRPHCVRLYDALTALPNCPEVKIVMTGNLGIDPSKKKVVVVKSMQHFHAAYAPIASEVLYVAAPGALVPDWKLLPYVKANRKQWPLVADPFAA